MKREKMLLALGEIDDQYIEEAAPRQKKQGFHLKKFAALAACICILLTAVNLVLFLPYNTDPPDVSEYKDSPYYPIIQMLNAATHQKPRYKNNFDRLSSVFSGKNTLTGTNTEVIQNGTNDYADEPSNYKEITDNQTEGVIEADLIKRSDKHIYYLSADGVRELRSYSIEGTDSALLGTYRLSDMNIPDARQYFSEDWTFYHAGQYFFDDWEFYLSTDCSTVTIISNFLSKTNQGCIVILSLDVSDPTNIVEKNRVILSGNVLSSRLANGKILLFSEFYVGNHPDFSDESTFLPQIDMGDGPKSIPLDDIVSPEALSSTRYTIISMLDEKTLALQGCTALLSYSDTVYVSEDTVYITRAYADSKKDGSVTVSTAMTEIAGIAYTTDTLTHLGSITVAGTVKDQYSLDEYQNILRIVTTTGSTRTFTRGNMISLDESGGTSASLYCVDLENRNIVAEVKDFAPIGESVRSVRFDKETAYVCTAIKLTDPVFFFDLSDMQSITYKETEPIDGFSSSLIQGNDGFLLGIGVGENQDTVKIEVYEETETGVRSVCKYEVPNAEYSTDYKSYLIDRDNNLIGLGITEYHREDDLCGRYLLLCFDGYELRELANLPLDGDDRFKRAVMAEGALYLFSPFAFKVVPIFPSSAE